MRVERGKGFGRNSLQERRRPLITSMGEVLPHRGFFVPAFAVRRYLFPDDAAHKFHERLTAFCQKGPYTAYPLSQMAVTEIEKGKFIDSFLRADVQPEPSDVLELAHNVRRVLGEKVKSKPHLIAVPLGGIAIFGQKDNKIAAYPAGWEGYRRAYASRNKDGSLNACYQLVREINGAVGEIVQYVDGGTDSHGEYQRVSMRPLERQTPHMTFATKDRGSITNNERVTLAGQLEEIVPDELSFFDPVIVLRLQRPGGESAVLRQFTNNPSEATINTAGLFVRRPKLETFGGIPLRQWFLENAA